MMHLPSVHLQKLRLRGDQLVQFVAMKQVQNMAIELAARCLAWQRSILVQP